MKVFEAIKSPTKREFFILRLLILLGLISMGIFLVNVFPKSVRGNSSLYWMLIATFVFSCLRVLHEWIHYFYITVPKTPPSVKAYTVDVFTTFCAGEPYKMIEETLVAIQNITYPHKTYLCDESDDPYLKNLCEELGVYHVTRTVKKDAKAGNINNALAFSTGELCVVLDPDHVPAPNFLDPIVSHFDNPKVGFVQIVQSYSNNDENLIAKGAAQQTYQFYGPMMMTMNKYGTVLAIGANCTFRRSALESIGGHAAGLAEDMHTAMQLHSKGWKSVYVPAVLARGLVPSTLSAYYAQQLKWSKGVFDLLFSAYPKLFKGFTWQQKLHYAVIPFHYLSGLIVLINFLIPILALFFNLSPIHINIVDFGLLILPFISSIVLIRYFVQKWVMEDRERGLHVVGGLLMIGTWWVFILGFFYALIKKKLPYIPTPKDNVEPNNWTLNIPNLVILFLSLAAIIYGLWSDWNPYNITMACFAGMNSLFMLFTIAASRQQQFRIMKNKYSVLNAIMSDIKLIRVKLWVIRYHLYTNMRNSFLMVTVILISFLFYFLRFKVITETERPFNNPKSDYFLTGIFLPDNFDGMSSLKLVDEREKKFNTHFDIVSFYIPWGDEKQCYIPLKVIDSVYSNGSFPMITWEPWQNLFEKNEKLEDKKVFVRIVSGEYDQYLTQFSNQVKQLNRPVFIRFAHEFDNPFYPWSAKGDNTPKELKAAWIYVHNFFEKHKVFNAVWVWNPWKESAVNAYFPGKEYVDWIGVTNLNYGKPNSSIKWASMAELYESFHRNSIFRSGIPVMLAEMGSLKTSEKQKEWFTDAFKSIDKRYPEIKALVFFNSAYDMNLPADEPGNTLNWNIDSATVFNSLKDLKSTNFHRSTIHLPLLNSTLPVNPPPLVDAVNDYAFTNVKGMNYHKGHNWEKDYMPFTNKELNSDFEEMKQMGVSDVRFYGPSIYDRNILKAVADFGLQVHYSFWIPDHLDYFNDQANLERVSKEILRTIHDLKNREVIVSWNIANPVFQKLAGSHFKPALLYQQDAYLLWLKKLVQDIKEIDSQRPISVDVEVTSNLKTDIKRIQEFIPEIDSYGMIVNDQSSRKDIELINEIKVSHFLSNITVKPYIESKDLISSNSGVFIANWQDDWASDHVSFDGIKDFQGRDKFSKRILLNKWKQAALPHVAEKFKILRPAIEIYDGQTFEYHAIIKKGNQWELASTTPHGKKLEWKLVKVDEYDNPISLQEIGEGNSLKIAMPKNHANYRLYLYVVQGSEVIDIVKTTLNTPLISKAELNLED